MNQEDRLLIWGAGGHARVVADIVSCFGTQILAFVDDARVGTLCAGAPVIGEAAALDVIGGSDVVVHVAVGDNRARKRLADIAVAAGGRLKTIVARSAVVSESAVLGPGTLICASAVVGPGTVLGACCIVNTAASVDHDCRVGDAAHLSPGVHLGGRVEIGDLSWLGVGCAVRDGVRIGSGSIVGVGSAVVTDLPDNVVAYGVPARVVRASEHETR